jgi:hypothetical protein
VAHIFPETPECVTALRQVTEGTPARPVPYMNECMYTHMINDLMINDLMINDLMINDLMINDLMINDLMINDLMINDLMMDGQMTLKKKEGAKSDRTRMILMILAHLISSP